MFDSHLDQFRYLGGRFKLKNFYTYKISGEDSQSFLHNFLTTNINNLKINQFHITCRLNLKGQLYFYAYIIRDQDYFLLSVPKYLKSRVESEFEKFIITEDVELAKNSEQSLYFYADPLNKMQKGFSGNAFYEKGKFLFQDEPKDSFSKILPYTVKILSYLTGWPDGDEKQIYFNEEGEGQLINNLPLNEIAVDYSKGCFLGQETAAKINNNRGAAKYPCLVFIEENSINLQPRDSLKVENDKIGEVLSVFVEFGQTIIVATLKREVRLEDNQLTISNDKGSVEGLVKLLPFFKDISTQEKSKFLLEEGQELFQQDDIGGAKGLLKLAIQIDSLNADAYESLGVILGRDENYDEAIELMNKLQNVDPHSVMAHTNKSLYLMKLGKIDEAEEEKALATVKTFEMFGREAKTKKQLEEESKKQEAEKEQRIKMFREVIDLDPVDEFANVQLARILVEKNEFDYVQSKESFLLETFPQNPEVYYILAKVYRGDEKGDNYLKEGLALAAKKGNQKILNDLNSLKKN